VGFSSAQKFSHGHAYKYDWKFARAREYTRPKKRHWNFACVREYITHWKFVCVCEYKRVSGRTDARTREARCGET
jgi:hypothetical protein